MPKVTNEDVRFIQGAVPIDTTGAAVTGDAVSMKNASHLTIIINMGAWAGGTPAVTLQQSTVVAETDGKALGFSWMWTNTASVGSSDMVKTAVTSNTFNLAATANSIYIIEVDADTLDVDNGFDVVSLQIASPGANADLIQVSYMLSGLRHQEASDVLVD